VYQEDSSEQIPSLEFGDHFRQAIFVVERIAGGVHVGRVQTEAEARARVPSRQVERGQQRLEFDKAATYGRARACARLQQQRGRIQRGVAPPHQGFEGTDVALSSSPGGAQGVHDPRESSVEARPSVRAQVGHHASSAGDSRGYEGVSEGACSAFAEPIVGRRWVDQVDGVDEQGQVEPTEVDG